MTIHKKQIFSFIGIFLLLILFIYLILPKNLDNKNIKIENQILNTNTWWTTINSVTSKLPDNFENKLKEEWKIKEIDLSFTKDWFIDKGNLKLNLRSNIKINIDAGNTWLPNWTLLNIEIPWADFKSAISIPWRYRYSIFFKQSWEQYINIYWDWLSEVISKKVIIR